MESRCLAPISLASTRERAHQVSRAEKKKWGRGLKHSSKESEIVLIGARQGDAIILNEQWPQESAWCDVSKESQQVEAVQGNKRRGGAKLKCPGNSRRAAQQVGYREKCIRHFILNIEAKRED